MLNLNRVNIKDLILDIFDEKIDLLNDIPSLNFKKEWNVKIVPPFACAVVRFNVEYGGAKVSVYLDVYSKLRYFKDGKHYCKIYPFVDVGGSEDTKRYKMNDTKNLINSILERLLSQLIIHQKIKKKEQ